MIWKTKITDMTGTKYPLIMAAFANLSNVDFAAAFSNAGGLGIVTAMNYDLDAFKKELIRMKELTDKPFGVNITIVPPGVRILSGRVTEEDYLNYLEVALNANVKIITSSAYQAPFIGKRTHEAGCYWFHKCSLIRHAISSENAGADAVTLIGMEAAGFKNPYMHTTLVNLTLAKKILKIPIISAGGIGDARGILGSLAMGAEAVCLGTAILTTRESPASMATKDLWLNTDILTKNYHRRLYHHTLGATRVPSPAVAYQKEIVPLKSFIENLMIEAEDILQSWGLSKGEFNTTTI
jgi:nitronate monooxygenase